MGSTMVFARSVQCKSWTLCPPSGLRAITTPQHHNARRSRSSTVSMIPTTRTVNIYTIQSSSQKSQKLLRCLQYFKQKLQKLKPSPSRMERGGWTLRNLSRALEGLLRLGVSGAGVVVSVVVSGAGLSSRWSVRWSYRAPGCRGQV